MKLFHTILAIFMVTLTRSHDHVTTKSFATDSLSCSEHIGEVGSKECEGFQIELRYFVETTLARILEQIDSRVRVRQIQVIAHLQALTQFASIGSEMDDFLGPRPWWTVVDEKRENFVSNYTVKSRKGFSSLAPSSGALLVLKLHRQSQRMEPFLHFLGAIQFPPPQICQSSRLIVGHMVNTGEDAIYPFTRSFTRQQAGARSCTCMGQSSQRSPG